MFTHPRVFQAGWVPDDLHARTQETEALATHLKTLIHESGEQPRPLLLSGPPGTGKTSTAEWVLRDLDTRTRVRTVTVDAWEHHKPYQAFRGILDGLGASAAIHPKTPRSVLRERLQAALPSEGVVVVLDEADQLDDPSLIDALNEITDVAVVLIANDEERFRDRLHRTGVDATLATTIPYAPYEVSVLEGILRPRAERGLTTRAWDEEVLGWVAAASSGNARLAIQSLRAAAEHADETDRRTITYDDVEAGRESAAGKIRRKNKSKLTRHERVVLDVVEDHGEAGRSAIYEAYVDVVGEEEARGERRVGDYLSKLEAYGQLESSGSGRGTTYEAVGVPVDA